MRWSLFCRVIDNFGDIGVSWRLAADLAARGERVRLWVDDDFALRRIAAHGAAGVEVRAWNAAAAAPSIGDVVVEAFGAEPPTAFVERMAQCAPPPVWVNLEYLSAEDYVERNHGLPSPRLSDPGRGLTRWFFQPGFSVGSGGLIHEPGLLAARRRFDRESWLRSRGVVHDPGERVVFVFCYDNPATDALLRSLAGVPTLLLLAQGPAQQALASAPIAGQRRIALPWLTQPDFDHALWSADLNFVRGEDSFVRAQWAAAPFVWQIYPQTDGVHARKLEAFIARFDACAGPLPAPVWRLWRAWNGLAPWDADCVAALDPGAQPGWNVATRRWREALAAQDDLTTRLLRFVAAKR